jgi:hypothetical protein
LLKEAPSKSLGEEAERRDMMFIECTLDGKRRILIAVDSIESVCEKEDTGCAVLTIGSKDAEDYYLVNEKFDTVKKKLGC